MTCVLSDICLAVRSDFAFSSVSYFLELKFSSAREAITFLPYGILKSIQISKGEWSLGYPEGQTKRTVVIWGPQQLAF